MSKEKGYKINYNVTIINRQNSAEDHTSQPKSTPVQGM